MTNERIPPNSTPHDERPIGDGRPKAVVVPGPKAIQSRWPIGQDNLRVTGGFWGRRLDTNRDRSIRHGLAQLEASQAIGNLQRAAAGEGTYVGSDDDSGATLPFLDSDVYKWLEAVGWELGREVDSTLAEAADRVIGIVSQAQRADGYLNSFVQLSRRQPFGDLRWGHELYCAGHLLQAAIAWHRAMDDDRLLDVGVRIVDRIDHELGEGRREGVDGHPGIEMALVETYRTTGDERHLRLARRFIDLRGRGLLGSRPLGAEYWQDHEPVRDARSVTGHAVRQMYLDCGAVDVATETGDVHLLRAVEQRWEDMSARTHLTGGVGSRHHGEAFGDRFELPPDRAYAETCAAIGKVMLAWRLQLATGDARYADAIERTLYNAVLPGVSLDGTTFFYVNPLRVRDRVEAASTTGRRGRAGWYPCACCPPNLMRTFSSFEQLLSTVHDNTIEISQFASARIQAPLTGGPVILEVATEYPWDGSVDISVSSTAVARWTLAWRVPEWCRAWRASVNDQPIDASADQGIASVTRSWQAGDRVTIDLSLGPRATYPDPRIDALRGTVAIERGPLVYCIEQVDLPGIDLDSVQVRHDLHVEDSRARSPRLPEQQVDLTTEGSVRPVLAGGWPYLQAADHPMGSSIATRMHLVPYFTWANRDPGPMRVWLPVEGAAKDPLV